MKTKRLLSILITVGLFLFMSLTVQASVYYATNPTGASQHGVGTTGTEFMVGDNDFIVEALGVWDKDGNGLASAHDIGIWNASGSSLLVSDTVASSTTATLESGFRWVSLTTPFTLSSNTIYVIGALYNNDDEFASSPTVTIDPAFSLVEERYVSPVYSLTYPDSTNYVSGQTGVFGPNIKGTVVPIPGALWLLGSGLIGIVGIRRKFKK